MLKRLIGRRHDRQRRRVTDRQTYKPTKTNEDTDIQSQTLRRSDTHSDQ